MLSCAIVFTLLYILLCILFSKISSNTAFLYNIGIFDNVEGKGKTRHSSLYGKSYG